MFAEHWRIGAVRMMGHFWGFPIIVGKMQSSAMLDYFARRPTDRLRLAIGERSEVILIGANAG
jgi:hypothetical protein